MATVPESLRAGWCLHRLSYGVSDPIGLNSNPCTSVTGMCLKGLGVTQLADVSRYAGAMWDREPVAWRVAYRVGWWPAVQVCQSEMALCRGECSPHTGGT